MKTITLTAITLALCALGHTSCMQVRTAGQPKPLPIVEDPPALEARCPYCLLDRDDDAWGARCKCQ
ncbi:hypothetical protein PGT21_008031 [Puccinia graminis f. sp. tritici]|uniref:Uncharacterized protein n=1 Tax=Puccinia graminis f. sp. tritici TaxID=56615 RepID=A0A5B0NJZ3_PUCGR|nr:hypothetical protein PGTUg99_020293 [Puccinia graminis f. sp. tritici]KAA1112740.1 hypothetical protein PGT21_008031 [Puccinia graminis f. sp. tritici]